MMALSDESLQTIQAMAKVGWDNLLHMAVRQPDPSLLHTILAIDIACRLKAAYKDRAIRVDDPQQLRYKWVMIGRHIMPKEEGI